MPAEKKSEPSPANSTMASRKAERERAEAAGEIEPKKPYAPRSSLRAGFDAESPVLVVTHVRA